MVGSLVIACLGLPRPALAYRPFDSTDAAVAAPSELEIELGPLGYLREGPMRSLIAPRLILNWGFASNSELVLEGIAVFPLGAGPGAPWIRIEDTALSLKKVLRQGALQDRRGPSVATEVGLLLPTVNSESGVGASAAAIVSQRSRSVTLHLNAEAIVDRDHELGYFAGVIIEGNHAWKVRPVAEVYVDGKHGSATSVSGLAGVVWSVRDGLSFDAAFRIARARDVHSHEVRAGVTWGVGLRARR